MADCNFQIAGGASVFKDCRFHVKLKKNTGALEVEGNHMDGKTNFRHSCVEQRHRNLEIRLKKNSFNLEGLHQGSKRGFNLIPRFFCPSST